MNALNPLTPFDFEGRAAGKQAVRDQRG